MNGTDMALSKRQIAYLNKIISSAQKMLDTANLEDSRTSARSGPRRRRRSSAEAEKMRSDILAKRAKGVSAAKLAEKYGVSTAYIYMIK
jgi:hypothetical protein